MLWPSRHWPLSNWLKSLHLLICPASYASALRTKCSLTDKYNSLTNRCHDKVVITPPVSGHNVMPTVCDSLLKWASSGHLKKCSFQCLCVVWLHMSALEVIARAAKIKWINQIKQNWNDFVVWRMVNIQQSKTFEDVFLDFLQFKIISKFKYNENTSWNLACTNITECVGAVYSSSIEVHSMFACELSSFLLIFCTTDDHLMVADISYCRASSSSSTLSSHSALAISCTLHFILTSSHPLSICEWPLRAGLQRSFNVVVIKHKGWHYLDSVSNLLCKRGKQLIHHLTLQTDYLLKVNL